MSQSPNPQNPNPNPGSFSQISKSKSQTEEFLKKVEVARERIRNLQSVLSSIVIGREDVVNGLILALIAGEHAVLIGPPGTAKSYLVKSLAKLLNAKYYQYLLTKFTSYDEIFGSVDIIALSKGEYKRNWSRIISADIIFLDEIFKANSAVLNALLSLLQERIVYDPMTGQEVQANLHTAVGASNEVPEDPELQALYDRFVVRIFIDYLSDSALLQRALEARWASQTLKPVASMDDVKVLHTYAMSIMSSVIDSDSGDSVEVFKLYHKEFESLVQGLRAKGVIVSDRTYIEKLPKIFVAYLAINSKRDIEVEKITGAPIDLLPYLAHSRDEYREIKKSIEELLQEVGELAKKLEDARVFMSKLNFEAAENILRDILNFDLKKLENKPWLKTKAEAIIAEAREHLREVDELRRIYGYRYSRR